MNTSLSGLTTRGRCLLAAGVAAAVCSMVLDERDLLRVSVFVVALPLIAALLSGRARLGISAVRTLLPARVPAGGHAEVSLRLSSKGKLPTTSMLLEDAVPYAAGAKPRFVVDRLSRSAKVELRYALHPMLRGIHPIGPLSARVGDPFGLAEFNRELGERTHLVVVPRTATLTGMPIGHGRGSGQDGSVQLRSGQGERDVIVRQYRHGDDLRKVHWRSTARRDELMVRLEERPWHSGTTVMLDHRASAHRGHGTGASLEWAISFAASVCLHLHAQRHSVRLITEDGTSLASENPGPQPTEAILDALAALRPTSRREFVATRGVGAERELIAVIGALPAAAVDKLGRCRPRGARALAVLLDVSAWAPSDSGEIVDVERTARLLRNAGWGVVVARPGQPLTQVWRQLCEISPSSGDAVLTVDAG
jgi:uncharacterized protein (DUF58 family)